MQPNKLIGAFHRPFGLLVALFIMKGVLFLSGKENAITLLCQKSKELNRLPKKSDFDELAVNRIKSALGPWPRALEAAGLKEPKEKKRRAKKHYHRNGRKDTNE